MGRPKKEGNPIVEFQGIKYACSRWPFLGCGGGVKFHSGIFVAKSEDEQKRVESTDAFRAGQIVVLKQRAKREQPSVEESAELAALKELELLKPQARRGMVSTSNMAG